MSGGNKYLAEKKHTKIKNAITKKLKKTAFSNNIIFIKLIAEIRQG